MLFRSRFADGFERWERTLLFDAQTSGGLLLAVPAQAADEFQSAAEEAGQPLWEVGEVVAGQGIDVLR